MASDPGTARLVRQAEEAQAMLRQTLDKLSETQGKLQACEEIISRTHDITVELRAGGSLNEYSYANLITALGPMQS